MDLVWSSKPMPSDYSMSYSYGSHLRLRAEKCIYPVGEPVGKSCDQVGKRPDGEVVAYDNDVFDKLSQSLHSACELLASAHYACLRGDGLVISAVIPMLVVPADRLWVVTYDSAGTLVAGPKRAKHVEYFADRSWHVGGGTTERVEYYSLSHIEICEMDYLEEFVTSLLRDPRLTFEAAHNSFESKFSDT